MIVIVAVDDDLGMMFNERRQSQDKRVREDILRETKGNPLWMNAYTEKQFSEEIQDNILVSEDPLGSAEEREYCFIENLPLFPYQQKLEKLIFYRWNRSYPSDQKFDLSLEGWKIEKTEELEGNSHKIITKEIWSREKEE